MTASTNGSSNTDNLRSPPGEPPRMVLGKADDVVRKSMLAALAVGIVPVPIVDMVVLSGIQLQMLSRLSKLYDVEFSDQLGKSLIAALVGGGTSVVLASVAAWKLLVRVLPSPAWAANALSTAALAGASTFAVGKVFIQHFESGGTLLTFQPDRVRSYYQEQMRQGAEEVRSSFAGVRP